MKRIFRTFLKLLFYVTYPILVVSLIVAITVLVVKLRELDALNRTFADATSQLNQQNQDKQFTIEDLKQGFTDLNNEVAKLKAENTDLKDSLSKTQTEGVGVISGKIFPVVSADSANFSQYQRVCAESTKNKNLVYCLTVSGLVQNFDLSVPAGTYQVYAEIYPRPAEGSALAKSKAFYTEYVKCAQSQDTSKCDQVKQSAAVAVEVKGTAAITNINPIDWR